MNDEARARRRAVTVRAWCLLITGGLAAAACAEAGAGRPGAPATPPATSPATTSGAQASSSAAPAPPVLRLDGSAVPTSYTVELVLDPARADFRGTVTIAVQLRQETRLIWLHGKRLQIERATVAIGGKEVAATTTLAGEFLALALPEVVPAGPATLRIAYVGQMPTTEQEGVFRQSDGGRTYIYTQFEATGARLAFPCFDEPAFKVPWQLTLHVPAGMAALSNTPVEKQTTAGPTETLVFARTRPLPSYLVALAVGPFDMVDLGRVGRNRTPMRIAVPRGRAAEARYAREVSGQLLVALERYFDMPYPYEKLDSVAVPSFGGAMENAGLVTYGANLLLAKRNEETPAFRQRFASIAAHELAHHWFGDLVTMAWWDDLWLNESFATFMADRIVDDWRKDWGIGVARVKGAQRAFEADGLITARKVHNPIRAHEDIIGAFDAISYSKGGALLDTFEGWMGRGPFQAAIRRYIARHAWGNATSQDFIAALAAESRPEVAAAFASFIEQGGIPLVTLGLECAAGKPPALNLTQERLLPVGSKGSSAQAWSVPMCVGFPDGRRERAHCFLLDQPRASVPLPVDRCPAWVDGNARRGYYRVDYQGPLGQALLARQTPDPAARAWALFNARAVVDAGRGALGPLLAAIPAVARDRDPEIVGVAIRLAEAIGPYVTRELRPGYVRFLASSFAAPARALGWRARPGESSQASRLRPDLLMLAAFGGEDPRLTAEARALAERYLANPASLDPELGAVVLATAARADARLFDRLEAAFAATQDHNLRGALLAGLVSSRGPGRRERTLARMTDGTLTIEELGSVALTALADHDGREAAYEYIVAHYEEITANLSPIVRPMLVTVAGFFCDQAHRHSADQVLRAKVKDMPGGLKAVNETVERIDLCIARRARFGAEVASFLAGPGARG